MEHASRTAETSPVSEADWKSLQHQEFVEQIDLLIRTAHMIRSTLNHSFAQLEINEVRYAALKVIDAIRESGCSQSELARKLGQSESNICTLIERMESDSLVVRQQSQKDRRKRVLQLTTEGTQILQRVKEYHGSVSQRLLAALTPDQRRQLTGMLQTLLKAAQVQRTHRETVRTVSDSPAPYSFRDVPAA